jgi:hypothetical protein
MIFKGFLLMFVYLSNHFFRVLGEAKGPSTSKRVTHERNVKIGTGRSNERKNPNTRTVGERDEEAEMSE